MSGNWDDASSVVNGIATPSAHTACRRCVRYRSHDPDNVLATFVHRDQHGSSPFARQECRSRSSIGRAISFSLSAAEQLGRRFVLGMICVAISAGLRAAAGSRKLSNVLRIYFVVVLTLLTGAEEQGLRLLKVPFAIDHAADQRGSDGRCETNTSSTAPRTGSSSWRPGRVERQ